MNETLASPKQKWNLRPEAFEKLLTRLGPTPESAGDQYLIIQRRLIKLFECRGCAAPEECADETMNRVARRIDEGEEIRAANILVYAYGIARNIVREQWDRPTVVDIDELPDRMHPARIQTDPEKLRESERRNECLRKCLLELPLESRGLLLEYYQGERTSKIDNRKQMAERLRVRHAVLRNRIFRLREKLSECMVGCVSA